MQNWLHPILQTRRRQNWPTPTFNHRTVITKRTDGLQRRRERVKWRCASTSDINQASFDRSIIPKFTSRESVQQASISTRIRLTIRSLRPTDYTLGSVKVNVKVRQCSSLCWKHAPAALRPWACMPYAITQSYLPPGRGSISRPYPRVLDLSIQL